MDIKARRKLEKDLAKLTHKMPLFEAGDTLKASDVKVLNRINDTLTEWVRERGSDEAEKARQRAEDNLAKAVAKHVDASVKGAQKAAQRALDAAEGWAAAREG